MRQAIRTEGEISVGPAPSGSDAVWNHFVSQRAESHYGHRYEWRRVAEDAYHRSCHFLMATRGDEAVGVLPMVWMPGRLGGSRLVSLAYLDLGGILAADGDAERALTGAALELAERLGARSIELRNSAPLDSDNAGTVRFRFLLDLPADSDELWSSVGSKVRNQVRKARKSGLTTAPADTALLPKFYRVFSRNMRDLGSPVHSRRFLASVLEHFATDAQLYLTHDRDGQVVAGAIGLLHRGALTIHWASSLRSALPLCPNHSLYWGILEHAIASGLGSFDFGRSSVGTGTYRFKRQWGATPVPLAWRRLDRTGIHPEARATVGRGSGLAVNVWRRLPLVLANRIGPLVRRHLPQ